MEASAQMAQQGALHHSFPPSPNLSLLRLVSSPSWTLNPAGGGVFFFLESAPESLTAALIISRLQLYSSNIFFLRVMDLKLRSSEELHNQRVTLRLRLVDAASQPCCSDTVVYLFSSCFTCCAAPPNPGEIIKKNWPESKGIINPRYHFR